MKTKIKIEIEIEMGSGDCVPGGVWGSAPRSFLWIWDFLGKLDGLFIFNLMR